jgi:hypothetical protein
MELVEQYKRGERREAVSALLDTIYHALLAVTVTGPDYETLMVGFPFILSSSLLFLLFNLDSRSYFFVFISLHLFWIHIRPS